MKQVLARNQKNTKKENRKTREKKENRKTRKKRKQKNTKKENRKTRLSENIKVQATQAFRTMGARVI